MCLPAPTRKCRFANGRPGSPIGERAIASRVSQLELGRDPIPRPRRCPQCFRTGGAELGGRCGRRRRVARISWAVRQLQEWRSNKPCRLLDQRDAAGRGAVWHGLWHRPRLDCPRLSQMVAGSDRHHIARQRARGVGDPDSSLLVVAETGGTPSAIDALVCADSDDRIVFRRYRRPRAPADRIRLARGTGAVASRVVPVGDVLALQMEDHYVRVHRPTGSELVLMPLRRAMECVEAEGLRVHRSWWVARHAVSTVEGDARSMRLHLSNGVVAPVARSAIVHLRSSGWITGTSKVGPPATGQAS